MEWTACTLGETDRHHPDGDPSGEAEDQQERKTVTIPTSPSTPPTPSPPVLHAHIWNRMIERGREAKEEEIMERKR